MIFCMRCGYSTWEKWSIDKVILHIDTHQLSIGDIPFPVVSICPITKTDANKFNYTDVYRAMLKLDGNSSRTVSPKEYYKTLNFVQYYWLEHRFEFQNHSFQMENNEHSCSVVWRNTWPEFIEATPWFICRWLHVWNNAGCWTRIQSNVCPLQLFR